MKIIHKFIFKIVNLLALLAILYRQTLAISTSHLAIWLTCWRWVHKEDMDNKR